jgi:hypothetical protein
MKSKMTLAQARAIAAQYSGTNLGEAELAAVPKEPVPPTGAAPITITDAVAALFARIDRLNEDCYDAEQRLAAINAKIGP